MAITTFGTSTSIGAGGMTGSLALPYYTPFLRENLYPSLYYRQLGTLITIPRGHGSKVRSSRWMTPFVISKGNATLTGGKGGYMLTAVGTLTETTVITPYALCANNITGQITGWGGARGYTDRTVIMSMANFIEGALESLSRELAFRMDNFVRRNISASALKIMPVNTVGVKAVTNSAGLATTLHSKNLARLAPYMRANGVPPWDDGAYVGVTHDLSVYDIFADISATGYVTIARYNDARRIYRGEIGEFYGVRLLLNNTNRLISVPGTGCLSTVTGLSGGTTGSNLYVFGPDAFYNLELESGGVEVWHQPLGSAGADDPIGQYGSVGVKVYYGVMPSPTADQRLIRMPHAISLQY